MERRFAVHARKARQALIVAITLASGSAAAAPESAEARAHFDRGVAAYTKGDFAGAAEALGKSYAAEADEETLFAWAQTERKLGRCDKAIELYGKLLAMNLPAENKQAINVQIGECKEIIAEEKAAAEIQPVKPEQPIETTPASPEGRAWWKDPVGGALVGIGAIGLGVGVVFLVQARSADEDKASAATYPEYEVLDDRAQSRGQLGVIGAISGGALVTAGIIWYATRDNPTREKSASTTVSGWLVPGSGGFAIAGGF